MACIVHSTASRVIPRTQHPSACLAPALPAHAIQIATMFDGVRISAVQLACSGGGRYLVLPLVGKVCAIAGREHGSNHPYVTVDLQCMRWRHACHNAACAANPQPWQAMPNFEQCKRMLPPTAPVTVPELCSDTPQLTVRARGPPPASAYSESVRVIRCCNGTYRLPHAQ